MQRPRGFTLIELLVVLAIMGFALAGVSLALRDNSQTQLEREAQRLVAVLEAARAQSRTSGIAMIWQAAPEGFSIQAALSPSLDASLREPPASSSTSTLPNTFPNSSTRPLADPTPGQAAAHPFARRTHTWLATGTQAQISSPSPSSLATVLPQWVVLGPEPILAPVRITLNMASVNGSQALATRSIGTDGLQPFKVMP